MYQYSYRAEGPWLGEKYDHPQLALDAGRANLGNVSRVFVGKVSAAYFSDMFIGGRALLSYMQEEAEGKGESFAESFEDLPLAAANKLQAYIVEAIGEWESELPEELQFRGQIIKQARGYSESAMVRPADFK